MSHPNFVILYVNNPESSARFYERLLGCAPIEASHSFAMFKLDSGMLLGLWSRHTVEPAAGIGSGTELVFAKDSVKAVDATHADWAARGLPVLQTPREMEFGYTFTAADPDGHRLRVYVRQGS
ncbi:VOC family protein [Ottowia thiooxydans]|uniref:VOC family protein n=1 Tax=Ottowia thiooxydans TaxID=219182 RepID=UPI00042466F5|nr:VOC family protein [Ottowia thiooxydans]